MALECDDCKQAAQRNAAIAAGAGAVLGALAIWMVLKYVAR